MRGAGRIAVCTAFRENPLLEVPTGVRRCGKVELCTAGNVSREVLESFGAIFIRAFECTACLRGNRSVQRSFSALEVNQNRCRFCKGLDGNRALLLAVLDFLAVIGPMVNCVACIRRSGQGNIGACGKAGVCTAVIRLAGIQTCGNDRRRTDRVLVCAFAEVLSLEGQDVSRAVYRVNTGDKGEFIVVVQRFIGSGSLARGNRVVAGRNVRLERYRIACGVDCGIVKVQSINLISSHVFRVCRERKLVRVGRINLILCNAVRRSDNAQRSGTLNNGKLGFRNRLGFAVYISIQRVSADIQLIVLCQRLRILRTGNRILEGCVIDLLQTLRILTHAGERRRYRIAVGEAGDAAVILAVGERQLIAGRVLANENHLTFRVAHILEYIAARIIRGNRICAVCGHDNILCNVAGIVNLSRNRGREVRAANQEAERAGRDGGGSRRGTHFSADVQRAVKLSSVVFLHILCCNIQLTLGRALAVLCGNFGRISGNAELLLGGVIEVEHIQSAAVSALVGRTGVFDAQRIGNAAGNLGPGTIVQLLPLIAYAVVLAAVRIFIVSVILNRCGCQRIRIDRQNRLIFLAVNRYRNIGIACCGLGAAGQRFAVNAVALLLSLVVVAGLNLIFILGIGRQVLIRVAEGVGAVIVTLTIGERHKCEFLASGAVREVVVAVQLETGNDLVVGPRQGDGIIGGFRNILLKILRQRRRSLRLGYRVGDNRERLIAAAVVVAEDAPVHAVAVRFCFNRHVLQRTGERAACGVDRHLAGRVFRTCHNACGYAACACTGLGFDRGGVGVVFAVRGGEADFLRDAGAAACRGEVNLSRITVISLGACTRCARIAGRITNRMRQHTARNGRQHAVILGNVFVVGQVNQTDRGFVRDGNGGGYFGVAALAIRDVGGILVNLHRDGIERHSVLTGGCLIGDGLLERGGVLGLVGETGGKGGFCLNAADLNAEYREFLLKGDVCADRDGRGGAGAVFGALHARVGGGGLGIVAGQVITVEQIGEVRRRSQYRQNLRVGVGIIVLAGVGHVAGIVVRVGETERVRAVDIGFYRLRAVKQVDGRKSGCTRRAGGVRCCLRCSSIYIADKSVVIGLFTEQLVPPALVVGTALVLRYFTGDVVGVRLLVFILGHGLRQGEQRTRTCGVVVFIHRGGDRACGCIVLNVVLVRHSRRVVKRLLDIQTILIAGDNKAVKVQQIAGFAAIVCFACGRTGDNRRIGRAQRQRMENVGAVFGVILHCAVNIVFVLILGEQIEILRDRRLEGDAVPCVQAYIARVLLICLEVSIRLSRQNQRFAAAGHIAEGEGCADQIAALVGQREFLRALQHVRARGAEHYNGTRACVLLRTVVVTPGAGEIVYAVLVDVTADERDHVGNDTALTEEVRPRLSPVRGIGVIFSLQVVNLNAGIADLRHIDRNLVLTVVVPVAGSYLQVVFQLIRIFCEVFDQLGFGRLTVRRFGAVLEGRVADFLAGVQQRDRLAVLAGCRIAEPQVQTAFRAQVTGVNHDRLRGLCVFGRGEVACGHVCHSVIGTIFQIGGGIGHAGQIALGGIAVIALAAHRELCVCAGRGGFTLGDFLGIGLSRQKLLSLGRCVIIIAVQRALKDIVLLAGLGNACIALLCAFTLVQIDFIRRQNIIRQTNGIQLVHRRNLDGIAPVWVAGVVGIKAVGRFARINTERRKRVRAAGIRRRCADIKRAAYAGDKSQCQSKAYAAFEFHGIFLLFPFCGAVERAAPAEKRLKIACVYHSSFAACCAVGHTKCPIFDTKYTDRKNRVNYA